MKFFRILKASLKQSFIYEMQYRINLIINSITGLGWTFMSFLTINIIGSNVTSISSNWEISEYRLLWGINFIAQGITSAICKRNIERLPEKILKGDLDFIITRPFSSKILASLGYIRLNTILGFIFVLFTVIKSLANIQNNQPLILNLLLLFIILIFSSIIYYSLMISLASLSFWFLGAHNLIYFSHNLLFFANYPIKAFGATLSFIFTFIFPIAFISTFPAEVILEFSLIKFLLIIIAAVLTYKISDLIWNLGLRNYSSASS